MKIITTPDARLREKSEKVRVIDDEIRGIIADMRKLSLDWEAKHPFELSAAMAAPQMGVLKRIIIVRDDMEDKKNASFTALINPEVIRADGKIKKDYEGCLVNEYRIKEAMHRMTDKRYADMTIEEIGNLVGFANRQSFYASFYRIMRETPNDYRKRHTNIR